MNPPPDKKTERDVAAEAWMLMSDLVLDQDRRRRVAEATGIGFSQARAVRRVARRPMPMRELAAMLDIEPPNASVLVNRLEEEGLVRRESDPADRRTRLVTATRKGKALARKAEAILRTPPPALSALGDQDLKALARILDKTAEPGAPRRREG
ncbi:MAG TPA: MarR family transcriptional regulator [Solirubrobacterales bacterium]|nr:MarR family transcriptional regulator [Solirubrobacterales bacterium]